MSMVSVPGLEVSDESEVTALFSRCKTKIKLVINKEGLKAYYVVKTLFLCFFVQ